MPLKFADLINTKNNQKLLLLGSGPSINSIVDINKLSEDRDIMCVGGSIQKVKPNYFVCIDQTAYKHHWYHMYKDDPEVIRLISSLVIKRESNDNYYEWDHKVNYDLDKTDLINTEVVCGAASTATFALHIAYLMGYKDILLCGMDFGVKSGKIHFYTEEVSITKYVYGVDGKSLPVLSYMPKAIEVMDKMISIFREEGLFILDISDGNLSRSITMDEYLEV